MANNTGANDGVAVYGDSALVTLLASVARLVELEPDRTFESADLRRRARQLTVLLHQRLAGTLEADEAG